MPDGVLLIGAGLACLVVLAAILIREDRRTGHSGAPDWRGWLLLAVGVAAIVSGAGLFWSELFSR